MRSLTRFARFFKGQAMGYLKEVRSKYHISIDVRLEEGKGLCRELVKPSAVDGGEPPGGHQTGLSNKLLRAPSPGSAGP
jgi:crotonobetainyl-CoA:carnitine CoA-transferase CaiB-like acyl-CoA transferase